MDVSVLRSELRIHLGMNDVQLPNADADLLLNRSYWMLLDTFPFREKEVRASFQLTQGVIDYEVPVPFEAVQRLAIENPDTKQHHVLDLMTELDYEAMYNSETSSQAEPFNYVRMSNYFKVFPTPDRTYAAYIYYWTVLADLSDSAPTPGIPHNWHEIILYGAVYRGFLRNRDLTAADGMQNQWKVAVDMAVPTEAKEEIDTHYAGVKVYGYDPNNIYG